MSSQAITHTNNTDMLLHLIAYLAVLLTGASGTWFVTEAAKQFDLFKLSTASTNTLRGTAGVLALLSTLLLGFVNHDIQPSDLMHAMLLILTVAGSWLGSHNIHKLTNGWIPDGLINDGTAAEDSGTTTPPPPTTPVGGAAA